MRTLLLDSLEAPASGPAPRIDDDPGDPGRGRAQGTARTTARGRGTEASTGAGLRCAPASAQGQ